MMTNIFDYSGDDCHIIYKNLRDGSVAHEFRLKEYLENLWLNYKGYAPKGFLKEFRKHPDQRYWEMYLGSWLIQQEIKLDTTQIEGPDFSFSLTDGRKVWIEAVCPEMGDSENQVPEPVLGIASQVPRDAIIARYVQAVTEKKKTFDRYINKSIVHADDIKIIALSSGAIRGWSKSGVYPYILSALYPAGNPYMTLDKTTGKIIGNGYTYQNSLKLKTRTNSSALFLKSENSPISAVLYSYSDIGNPPTKLGKDFILIRNNLACSAVPEDIFNNVSKYACEEDEEGFKITSQ